MVAVAARTQELSYMLTPDQAVALFNLVASSDYRNGLGGIYVALGDLVRDENGHVPSHVDYQGPAWA